MKRIKTFLPECLLSLLIAFPSAGICQSSLPSSSETVQVFAAGSLREALTKIAKDYQDRTGQPIALTFGASGLLRERLEKGEPASVFASADTTHPKRLSEGGNWQPPVVFARNSLCALTSERLAADTASLLNVMLRPEVRVGTSTPKSDPSGDYAWAMFEKAEGIQPGAFKTLDGKAMKLTGAADSPQPPTGRTFYGWAMDEDKADVFLTYCTNAVAARSEVPRLKVVQLPAELQVGSAYGLTVAKNANSSAKEFAMTLLEGQAQAVFEEIGFGRP